MLLNTSNFTRQVNAVVSTDDYIEILNATLAKLERCESVHITNIEYNGNHIALSGKRFVGYVNNVIVHFYKERLTPRIAKFYLQGNGISYSGSDLILAEISNLINRTVSGLTIIEVKTIAHSILDGIVSLFLEQQPKSLSA